MGHRFSKSLTTSTTDHHQQKIENIPTNISSNRTSINQNLNYQQNQNQNFVQPSSSSAAIATTTINLITNQNLQLIQTNTNSLNNQTSGTRFIIKIQLTKMESPSSQQSQQQQIDEQNISSSNSISNNSKENNNNLNITTQRPQILNLTFTKNIPCDLNVVGGTSSSSQIEQNNEIKLNNLDNINNRSAGSPVMVNNNFISNFSTAPFIDDDNNDLNANNNNNNINNCSSQSQFNRQLQQEQQNNFVNNLNISVQRLQDCNILDNSNCNNISNNNNNNNNIIGAEYQDVPDINQRVSTDITNNRNKSIKENNISTMCATNPQDQKSHCCRRKSSSSSSSAYPSKWRCCKCACRDAVKKIVNTSGQSSSTNCQNRNDNTNSAQTKSGHNSWTSRFSCNNKKDNNQQQSSNKQQISNENSLNLHNNNNNTVTIPSVISNAVPVQSSTNGGNHFSLWSPDLNANIPPATVALQGTGTTATNHLALWSPTNEVVFPITARPGEILVVQCPQSLVCRIEDFEERARRRREIEIETGVDILSQAELDAALSSPWHPIICSPSSGLTFTAPGGTVVHSRVDYIHCLVPDLEKITSSSFYWGKMDRYEAERLLEGKPEGTFLLRDSAQEEYLFSVTFRKYGRSLHARIEQFNHKFSFDCHDPGVFTAPTVTGLLEHYKDPSCVMFFEPMLTIPLNRNFSFSLQQLCRAKIVSNISYDGINELQLPNSLKCYLKEYHYKLRVRVKPFDEPFYSCS